MAEHFGLMINAGKDDLAHHSFSASAACRIECRQNRSFVETKGSAMIKNVKAPRTLVWPVAGTGFYARPVEPRFAAGAAYVDGQFCPIEEARIPLLDWGFLRSDACQDTISVWDGSFFRLQDHLERFQRSVGRLRMISPEPPDRIRSIVHELVVLPGFRNAYVQIIMTRGRPPIGSRDLRLCQNRFQAFSMPYMWVAAPEVQARGMSLHISRRVRVPSQSVDPLVKHYHWLDFQMGLFDAYDAGAETVILVDLEGHVTEGPGFNIFADIEGRLVTPGQGVLDGMTRRSMLEICRDLGIEAVEGKLTPEQLRSADEVFLTTTAGGVIPVTRVDDRPIGDRTPGPKTVRLHTEYWKRRAAGWYAEPVVYRQVSEGIEK
jgi:branched-chain amino acid aminotransferase